LRYQKLQHVFECCLSAFTEAHDRFAAHLLLCSKSAQKSLVQMSQIATVVMETTQLVLNQLKIF